MIDVALIIILVIIIFISGAHLVRNGVYVYRFNSQRADEDCNRLFRVISDDMTYATDVTLRRKEPNKLHHWHAFYVRNGMLYHDQKIVAGKDWYRNHKVKITYVAYIRSKSRIDFTIRLYNQTDHYEKRLSLALLHFKLVNSVNKNSPVAQQTYDLSITDHTINKNKLKLYYYRN